MTFGAWSVFGPIRKHGFSGSTDFRSLVFDHPLNRRFNTQDAVTIQSSLCSGCNHSRCKIDLMDLSFVSVVTGKLFTGSEM